MRVWGRRERGAGRWGAEVLQHKPDPPQLLQWRHAKATELAADDPERANRRLYSERERLGIKS